MICGTRTKDFCGVYIGQGLKLGGISSMTGVWSSTTQEEALLCRGDTYWEEHLWWALTSLSGMEEG